jgi:hypothetical protein
MNVLLGVGMYYRAKEYCKSETVLIAYKHFQKKLIFRWSFYTHIIGKLNRLVLKVQKEEKESNTITEKYTGDSYEIAVTLFSESFLGLDRAGAKVYATYIKDINTRFNKEEL